VSTRKRLAVTQLPSTRPLCAPSLDDSCLVVIDGPRLGHCVHLHDVPVVIGRSPKADFQVDHRSVSRLHCTVWRERSVVCVRDLESKNGTCVNGSPIAKAELGEGDYLTLGDVVLKFVLGGSLEARYHEALYQLATLDSLTQLHNRREFGECLNDAVNRIRSDGSALSVVIFDMDHFKQINDVLGHDVGDAVLRRLATVLQDKLHSGDMAGRLGGDEFAVLLRDTGQADAIDWCENLRASMDGMGMEDSGLPTAVTISVGVATSTPVGETARELMHAADMALLRAKANGRNRVCQAGPEDRDLPSEGQRLAH
jgi:diguanylate cyclase (GGDEF)-like protein